ncbi:class I SAM-dependent methyltransferase [Hyalangium rubrum]|uniref:Class I SAM-dependent methyltransferase n=1 Tax=Hyalangium rubrum TaxID=3103134 RepID=A0ABU5H761_9BACT|nr:class I SAM-dependent methyltransferase [Hyalangium sp. s54d21]MDY7228719.1 class I SAM-dependent methyltransferase [Hyalangium sp. s54d21]
MALRETIVEVAKDVARRAVRVPTVQHLIERAESLANEERNRMGPAEPVAPPSPPPPAVEPLTAPLGQHGKQERYGEYWDFYVDREFPELVQRDASGNTVFTWPGDEWGDEQYWRQSFDKMFKQHVPPESTRFAEIGPGSGKYSLMVLEAWKNATVAAFDVSRSYLKVLEKRCAPLVADGRLRPFVIEDRPDIIDRTAEQLGWAGELDCLYSMDAMVHVDLQYLVAYWLSAARTLRIGGKLIMSVADATSDGGFNKLVGDVPVCFPLQGKMCPKFEWLSPQLVEQVLGRLGFVIEATYNFNHRDFFFVARLERRPTP